ncbi:MAG: CinA family protein [Silicimonas sp.]|nr:CinA family protein [Silicimonas sp.]NNF90440.1 CinA family protein [Boseongicola sp.]RZW10690.1 MAG: CinA family protein [Paracoccaceae bacterium]NND21854.1 CinA family protein [Silicimonas sp.]NNL35653.1 CinA family protein [Silicimonas sp.]
MNAEALIDSARKLDQRIATAESCTGGMIAAALTDIPGSSDVFDRGYITYSNAAKIEMLGVPREIIDLQGAVSEDVAAAMAERALDLSDATITVSVTGIAGPGGSEHKPEGRVCFGLARRNHPTETETVEFGALGRENVRRVTVNHALMLLLEAVLQNA